MIRILLSAIFVVAFGVRDGFSACAAEVAWSGAGGHRVLIQVDPVDIGRRDADQLVAQHTVDFVALLKEKNISGEVDLATIQIHKYNPQTGQAESFPTFDGALSEFDRPVRFEDNEVPEDFPDRLLRASAAPNGKGPPTMRKRYGRLFNREMENTAGTINWVHTQAANQPSHYAIYWDVKPSRAQCGPAPAAWLGDADVLRRKDGESLAGLSHFSSAAGDLNGDGLFDLIAGVEKGNLMWFPNRGTPGEPRFIGCKMVSDEDGPIDLGWYAAPVIFDWDNDGLPDVLAGTAHNVILWWKNTGTKTEPRFSYEGFVQSDGARLEVPKTPVPEDKSNIFKNDYYNTPWIGDFDGDGMPDILTGGYITGRIFYFKGSERNPDGTPALKYVGPLEADGETIDTVWHASPVSHDFDGDGKMDLLTGSWFWSGIHRPRQPGEADYLMYFRNVGEPGKPLLKREKLPLIGEMPVAGLVRPNVVDWNGDDLPDLLINEPPGKIVVFLNKGKPGAPQWQVDRRELTAPWAFARGGGFETIVESKTGETPVVFGGRIYSTWKGSPHSPQTVRLGEPLVDGKFIQHPGPGYGDHYYYMTTCDWDGDGHADILYGTQQGNVFFHRNLGEAGKYSFAPGVQLKLTNGEALKVGPEVVDSAEKAKDFTVLQGSRIVLCGADFDGDGVQDLAITETYGNIWIFRNTRKGGTDSIEPGVQVGKVFGAGRTGDLSTLDWNEDGKPDLIIGTPVVKPGSIYINQSTSGKPAFADPVQPFDLPFMFWSPIFKPLDWNQDGDEDFLVFAEFYSFFVEKSFLQHGYIKPASVSGVESRKN